MKEGEKKTCRDCAKWKGNCGNHFIDSAGHIDYDIAREGFYDSVFAGDHAECFVPSEEYKEKCKREMIEGIVKRYSKEQLEEALIHIIESENKAKEKTNE